MSSTTNPVVSFRKFGFVVLPGFLGAAEQALMRRSCDVALARIRRDNRETAHSTPRISLLTEISGDDREELLSPVVEFASSQRVCTLLRAVSPDMPLGLKDVHYYHEQVKRDWDGDWHRDSQFGRPEPERERMRFETTLAVHVRVAFEHDDRLEIVPGSHARWDTPEELRMRKGPDRATAPMPNAKRMKLRAGDGCLFHAWSIHRATYRCTPIRRTLDVLYGVAERLSFPSHEP